MQLRKTENALISQDLPLFEGINLLWFQRVHIGKTVPVAIAPMGRSRLTMGRRWRGSSHWDVDKYILLVTLLDADLVPFWNVSHCLSALLSSCVLRTVISRPLDQAMAPSNKLLKGEHFISGRLRVNLDTERWEQDSPSTRLKQKQGMLARVS